MQWIFLHFWGYYDFKAKCTVFSHAHSKQKKNSKINLLCFIFCGGIHSIFPFSTLASRTFNNTKMNNTSTPYAHRFHFRSISIGFCVCVCLYVYVCLPVWIDFHVDRISVTLNRNIMWIKRIGPVCMRCGFNWIQSCLIPG